MSHPNIIDDSQFSRISAELTRLTALLAERNQQLHHTEQHLESHKISQKHARRNMRLLMLLCVILMLALTLGGVK